MQFHLPDIGWLPIDALKAEMHSEHRGLNFGSHPPDRIRFTVGRHLELGEGHTTGPLSTFIYPHMEVAGRQIDGVKARFLFAEVPEGKDAAQTALKEPVRE